MLSVEKLQDLFVFRHIPGDDLVETFGMVRDDEMGHFMQDDVSEAFLRIMDEPGRQMDAVLPCEAYAPFGLQDLRFQFRISVIAVVIQQRQEIIQILQGFPEQFRIETFVEVLQGFGQIVFRIGQIEVLPDPGAVFPSDREMKGIGFPEDIDDIPSAVEVGRASLDLLFPQGIQDPVLFFLQESPDLLFAHFLMHRNDQLSVLQAQIHVLQFLLPDDLDLHMFRHAYSIPSFY